MTIFLETERLILRQFTKDDADNLFELNSDLEVTRLTPDVGQLPNSTEIQTKTLPQYLAYYELYDGYGCWAAVEKSSQAFIGWFYLRPAIHAAYFNPQLADGDDIELGYRLCKAIWGKGYATEGAKALIWKGFREVGMHRVFTVALAVNAPSIRVMEKIGLKREKRFLDELGNDLVIHALNKDEFESLSRI
ncbi:GNAT family N-acetyltransferase [Gloeocapsopsis sp. IPPAS B-1203]|uniref:GNAT family N-acetyltransferase n=1 Tax=Gloeocapsopsis sp. IPPAS B-1203 TaxID=2049454 RepID=UPI000C173F4B|nr:GNAT family N-acetyltransferase [Gloeocapsopsis sp. IPPAS B-1203]PIG92336.1 GNAT family N-acetyltransferase [Gloeocapsopsis sp. IPPAS B-1203]